MLYNIVSEASKLGMFRWSGFFSYHQTRTIFLRNQLWASTLRPEPHRYSFHPFQIESSGTFLHMPHFHNAISNSVRSVQTGSCSDGLDFFPIIKLELFPTESTIGIYSRTGTASNTLSISSKSNLLKLVAHATFPQCYIT